MLWSFEKSEQAIKSADLLNDMAVTPLVPLGNLRHFKDLAVRASQMKIRGE